MATADTTKPKRTSTFSTPEAVEDFWDQVGRPYRLSVDQYHRMAEAGIIGPDDRVELLEGRLVAKLTKNNPHIVATNLIQRIIDRLLGDDWFVSTGNPVLIPDDESEPEPDLQVVRGDPRDYLQRKAGPQDVPIVIEVSDSSYRLDKGVKLRSYARAGIAAYWVVNVQDLVLEIHEDPAGPADAPTYRSVRTLGPGEVVALVLDGREVARLNVADLLP